MTPERLHELTDRYINNEISPAELRELNLLLDHPAAQSLLEDKIYKQLQSGELNVEVIPGSLNRQLESESVKMEYSSLSVTEVPRIRFQGSSWLRYAAAILLLIGVGAYFYFKEPGKDTITLNADPIPVQNDIAPGSNRATLTLSNGAQIELKEGAEVLNDAGVSIKKASGELVYGKTDIVALNTMTTPRGGQYKLTLPDGSRVWLNAASSITYPTAFTDKERHVTITGEAYFEVFRDKSRPFKVTFSGANTIEVLGTHFNVNAYTDEPSAATTLLEGSVKINNNILQPGEAYRNGKINKADVSQAVAWKEGKFSFQDTDIQTVMRQLARWYDVEVEFRGKPDSRFFAIIKRSLNLSDLLKALQVSGGVKFVVEGKKIIVQ